MLSHEREDTSQNGISSQTGWRTAGAWHTFENMPPPWDNQSSVAFRDPIAETDFTIQLRPLIFGDSETETGSVKETRRRTFMGIDIHTARFLLARRKEKASFERCATLGRQHYYMSNSETRSLLKDCGLVPDDFPNLFPTEYPTYSEPFWQMLGAKTLHTIDASNFEGATHVHDMNQPVPDSWKTAYDAVCDCGTLEHVFNFPVAIRNCMEMVKCGGYFFTQTPANNYLGHGFYQFSPELFFRVLSPKNGFKVEYCIAVECGPRCRLFAIADPEAIRARVALINAAPVILFVWAKRVEIKPLFLETPQQSDYAAAWAVSAAKQNLRNPSSAQPLERIKNSLLLIAPRLARVLDALRFSRFNRRFSFRNSKSFTRISKPPR